MKATFNRSSLNKLLGILLCVYLHRSHAIKRHILSVSYSNYAKNRRQKKRLPWSSVNNMLNDTQFRHTFRMKRECFTILCENITYESIKEGLKRLYNEELKSVPQELKSVPQ